MHTAITFDTHSLVKRLKSVGFTEDQSEVFAEEQARIINERLATKQDTKEIDAKIESVRAELKRDMKGLETNLKRDIKELDAKFESVRSELKRDIKELDAKIESVRVELKRDMKELEYRMTIKLGTLMVVAVGAVAALVKLL